MAHTDDWEFVFVVCVWAFVEVRFRAFLRLVYRYIHAVVVGQLGVPWEAVWGSYSKRELEGMCA